MKSLYNRQVSVWNPDTSKEIVRFVHEVHPVFAVTLSTFLHMLCGLNDDTMPKWKRGAMLTCTLLSSGQRAGEHCASPFIISTLRINRCECLSLGEVGLKNSCRKNQLKNSFTGSCHEPVLKGAHGAPALKPVPNKMLL